MNQGNIFTLYTLVFSVFIIASANISVASELEFSEAETLVAQNISLDSEPKPLAEENKEIEVKLDEFRVPDAPALSIIGSPKIEISKPATPRAFGLSLIQSASNSESVIPRNFAIDVAPYWWSKRTFNTLDDYICKSNDKKIPEALTCDKIGFGESLVRSLTFSIASSGADEDKDTRVGLGLRFSIIPGEINPAFIKKLDSISPENLCIFKIGEQGENQPLVGAELEKCRKDKFENLTNIGKELQQLNATRVGWQLDFASASALDFKENNFDNAEFTRFGTWLTASYRPTKREGEASSVTFLGIGRYLYNDFKDKGDNLFDLGGRLVWSPTKNPLSASVEYLRRFGDDEDDRLVALAEYKFNDTYSIFASFGKGFEEDFTGNEDLVTFLGINIGLGQKPKAVVTPHK